MKIISSPQKIQKLCLALRQKKKTIGVVPTMGYLHEGHFSLLKAARKKTDIVVLTIFVNPTQFGPKEDLSRYPRDTKRDLAMAKKAGVDLVFMPSPDQMYPEGYENYVEVGATANYLCGASRPGHFRGVATIVNKLFLIIQPHLAFFGQKDFQQLAVIKRMVVDFNLPVKIIGLPTVREKDGLAMSSRNVYLNSEERTAALCLSKGFNRMKAAVKAGKTEVSHLIQIIQSEIVQEKLVKLDYLSCMDADSIQPLNQYRKNKTLFAVAAFVGKTRLIDNVVV